MNVSDTNTGFPRKNSRILVVGSDISVCTILCSQFEPLGYDVSECHSSHELYSLNIDQFNLIIVDLEVDNDGGLNIIEQIKQSRNSSSVAVIACSGKSSPNEIINALNAGADDYILKPFSVRELVARVRSVLRWQQ